jgi:hypothetical protein
MSFNFPSLLTVALALTYVFFVVSIFVSGLGEFINTVVLDRRAVLLRRAFETMFGDPAFAEALYAHPLVKGQITRRRKVLLEHLPFVRRSGRVTATEVEQLPSYIAPQNFSAFVMSLLHESLPPGTASPLPFAQVGSAAVTLGGRFPDLQHVIEALLPGAADENDLKARLEAWYNEHMERISGFFKRDTQETLRYVALVLAVLLNIDTIQLTHRLFTDPVLAGALAAQAETVVEETDSDDAEVSATAFLRQRRLQRDRNRDSLVIVASPDSSLTDAERTARQDRLDSHRVAYDRRRAALQDTARREVYRRRVEKLRDLASETVELPVGWSLREAETLSGWDYVLKPTGWLLTMVAASFGAPFWFDVLILLVNIRNVGRKPEEPKKK